MKISHILLFILSGLLISCGGEDGLDISEEAVVLSYDGDNDNAPTLPAGLFEYAIRLPSILTRNVEGRSITQVSFYLYNIPEQLYINISQDATPTEPGAILNTQLVENLTANDWNNVTLNTPFPLDGSPVWVGIEVTLNREIQTVGCDAGPANVNGNWLYDEETMTWESFVNRTNQSESVNWNIKAVVN